MNEKKIVLVLRRSTGDTNYVVERRKVDEVCGQSLVDGRGYRRSYFMHYDDAKDAFEKRLDKYSIDHYQTLLIKQV